MTSRYRLMSFLARYFSSLRRRRPAAAATAAVMVVLVHLQVLGQVVDTLVSSATWTSGEPVSPSLVAYSARISFLTAVSSGT